MNHHAKAGVPFSKDTVVELMLKHAKWLIEGARRQVDVQSWKEFAKTKVLDVGEEWDVEAEGPEFEHLDRSTLDSPGFLTLSPKRKRVRSRARPQVRHLLNALMPTAAKRRFPVLPRIRLRRPAL